MKNLWIAGILIPVVLASGWSFSQVDIHSMRTSYAISPDAVIMFTQSDCGSICTDKADLIKAAGLEVVALDINDGTAGSHLWQALDGGDGPLPAFLVSRSDHLQKSSNIIKQ